MIKKLKVPEIKWEFDESIPRLTVIKDLKAIVHLTRMCNGNIMEIGCHIGTTTNELCRANPSKKIYALDYVGLDGTMAKEQKKEMPKEIGALIKKEYNFQIINKKSQEFNFFEMNDVGFIFIDGDHSIEGVKSDTEKSMEYLLKRGNGIICWHDYREHNNPEWCGVKNYLDELSLKIPIKHFEETWVAYTKISRLI